MKPTGRDSDRWILVKHDQNHMGTTFSACISCRPERETVAATILTDANLIINQLENQLTEFLETSPVYQLNHQPEMTKIPFSTVGIELLQLSEKIGLETLGFFDCKAKSKVRALELAVELPQVIPQVVIDDQKCLVWKPHPGIHLSFGAIGKGYALDRVRLLLEQEGFHDYLLCAGGSSIILSGHSGPGKPWRFGFAYHKDNEGTYHGMELTHHSGQPISLGVSGSYEKGNHIVNPRCESNQEQNCTLVAHPSAAYSDAYSTALYASGWEKGQIFIENLLPHSVAAIATQYGLKHSTPSFKRWWQPHLLTPILLTLQTWTIFLISITAFTTQLVADEQIDLTQMGDFSQFTPYLVERNSIWILVPLLALSLVFIHLRQNRRKSMSSQKTSISNKAKMLLAIGSLWLSVDRCKAVEIEPLAKSLQALLGTTKVLKKTFDLDSKKKLDAFYIKDSSGKPEIAAFIEHGLYEPNCTHTWTIGVDAKTGKIREMRVVEMSCPHAFPTKEKSFLNQFKGKGISDAPKVKSQVHTIAKATGSSILAAEAIQRTLENFNRVRGKF